MTETRGPRVTQAQHVTGPPLARRPAIAIHMTRVDAEVWHLDGVEIDREQWDDSAGQTTDVVESLTAAVKEAFYELGYTFDDDEPIS